jgi:hypothetical protein
VSQIVFGAFRRPGRLQNVGSPTAWITFDLWPADVCGRPDLEQSLGRLTPLITNAQEQHAKNYSGALPAVRASASTMIHRSSHRRLSSEDRGPQLSICFRSCVLFLDFLRGGNPGRRACFSRALRGWPPIKKGRTLASSPRMSHHILIDGLSIHPIES